MSTDPSADSPARVVAAAFRAFRARDGHALAALSSPASLQHFRDDIIRETHPLWHTWTAEAIREHDPQMPLEVAEWRVRDLERHRDGHEQRLLARFPGTASIQELESLDPGELLHRVLLTAPIGALQLADCRILGHVLDGETHAYVLFRLGSETEQAPFEDPAVGSVELIDGKWKLVLDPHGRWGVPGFRNLFFVEGQ